LPPSSNNPKEGGFMETFGSKQDGIRYMDLALEAPSEFARETLKRLEKSNLTAAQLKRLVRRHAHFVLGIDNMWRISRKSVGKVAGRNRAVVSKETLAPSSL
jgi:hypothetical protein